VTSSTTTPLGAADRVGSFVRDTGTMTRRNLLRLSRSPQVIVFSTIQPVMFVLLFNFVFGGSIEVEGLDYIDFLIPGVMVQTAMFGGGQTAVGITQDLQKGSIDRFLSLPMSRAAILFGRTSADALRAVVPASVAISVGFLLGFRPSGGPLAVVGAIVVSGILGHAFYWVFVCMGLYIRDPEAVQVAAFLPTFPLVFAASTFAPVENMPGWLQAFAAHQPVTVTVDALRAILHGGDVAEPLVQSIAWSAGITIVAVAIALRKFERL
jgi:ABC-2 type transport system permease protein